MEEYKCNECQMLFSRKAHLKRHVENIHKKEKKHQCSKCFKRFGQRTNKDRHEERCQGEQE